MCRQRTRISPAAAILSTFSGVLRMIILYTLVPSSWHSLNGLVGLEPQGRQGALDLVGDRVGRHCTVDLAQQALAVVVLDQGRRLLVVLLEPVADHLGFVVVAGYELAAVDVANALLLGRVELDME